MKDPTVATTDPGPGGARWKHLCCCARALLGSALFYFTSNFTDQAMHQIHGLCACRTRASELLIARHSRARVWGTNSNPSIVRNVTTSGNEGAVSRGRGPDTLPGR